MFKKAGYIQIIRKKVVYLSILLTILIASLITIIHTSYTNHQEELILIDVFGRQRMLTQRINKDVNNKYAMLHAIKLTSSIEREKELQSRVNDLNQSITESKIEFYKNLIGLKSGKLDTEVNDIYFYKYVTNLSPTIAQIEEEWSLFSSALDVLVNRTEMDEVFVEAYIYINESSERLLELSDTINKELITRKQHTASVFLWITALISFSSLALLMLTIYQINRYIITPMDELYNGVFNLSNLRSADPITLSTNNVLTPVVDEINDNFKKLNKLLELIENINQDTSFEGILDYIYRSFSEFIPYNHIGIALLKNDNQIIESSYGISDRELNDLPRKLIGTRVSINHTSLVNIIIDGNPRVINDLVTYTSNKKLSTYNQLLLEAGIKSSITMPLKINNKPVGVIFFSSTKKHSYESHHIDFLQILSNSIAFSLNKNIYIDELFYSNILSLAKMAEARDEDTGEHLERMKSYSIKVTELLLKDELYRDEITQRFIKAVERFSPMHDIGKVGVRDRILLKPGKLTPEEFKEMTNHTIYGADVLKTAANHITKYDNELFNIGINIALSHHEKWDGSGYPYQLKEYEIPLSARIVAIADVLDALTSRRPYKEPFTFEESFDIIVNGRGKHFDPNIVDCLIKYKDEMYNLYRKLNK